MPQTPHVEKHFTASETVRDIVIGMSDGLTVPFALAAGLSGAVEATGIILTAGLAEIAAGSIAMGLGGTHGHDVTQVDAASCHRYDPATNKWVKLARLPDGRSHFEGSTFVSKGRIVVVSGRCNNSKPPRGVVGDILEYDPQSDAWAVVGEMPDKVLAPSAAIIGGRLVVTGGGLNNPRPLTAATWVTDLPGGK
jgi:N-acetylneuraminic acid mutarotase